MQDIHMYVRTALRGASLPPSAAHPRSQCLLTRLFFFFFANGHNGFLLPWLECHIALIGQAPLCRSNAIASASGLAPKYPPSQTLTLENVPSPVLHHYNSIKTSHF